MENKSARQATGGMTMTGRPSIALGGMGTAPRKVRAARYITQHLGVRQSPSHNSKRPVSILHKQTFFALTPRVSFASYAILTHGESRRWVGEPDVKIGTSYYIDREIVLNDLARYLDREVGEGHIIGDTRLRQIAYRCRTDIDITPEMDAEILARVRRLRASRTRSGAHRCVFPRPPLPV